MEKEEIKNLVALVGRPNVGKSTLFNRLVGKRIAIESPIAGTTRDMVFGETLWRGKSIELVDLAGVEKGENKNIITKQTQDLVESAKVEADIILFVTDSTQRDNELDKFIARTLRNSGKEVILVVNKVDNKSREESLKVFQRLGNFETIGVSAISGRNTGDLLDLIAKKLVSKKRVERNENAIKLVIAGRPNVGKSTLLNQIIGSKKAIVSDIPGTTRDIVTAKFMHKGEEIELFDTAGIRRRGKIVKDTLESFSVLRTFRAMETADIVILMIDASEGLVANDAHILGYAKEHGKGIVLAVNKIDLAEDKEEMIDQQLRYLQERLNFVPFIPVIFISAQTSENIKTLLSQVVAVSKNRLQRIDQEDLNQILEYCHQNNTQTLDLIEIKQSDIKPPVFEIIAKKKKLVHESTLRYLENRIRDVHPLNGTPIIFYIDRKKPNK